MQIMAEQRLQGNLLGILACIVPNILPHTLLDVCMLHWLRILFKWRKRLITLLPGLFKSFLGKFLSVDEDKYRWNLTSTTLSRPFLEVKPKIRVLGSIQFKQLHLGCLQYKLPNFLETGIDSRCDNLLCPWVTHLIEVEDAPEVLHLNRHYPLLIDMSLCFLSTVKEAEVTTELAAQLIHLLRILRPEQHGRSEVESREALGNIYQIRHNLWRHAHVIQACFCIIEKRVNPVNLSPD